MDRKEGQRLHTVPEARRRLSLGNTKVYELIRTGELRTVKIGARRLVPESEIDAYIDRLMGEAPTGDPAA